MTGRDEPVFDFDCDAAGLRAALDLLCRYRVGGDEPPVRPADPLPLPDALPEDGAGASAALRELAPTVLGGAARLGAPGFFAHMDPPTPWVAWAATLWAASLNQNLLHPDTAPAARPLEERAVAWLAPFFGMRGGHLVPGSTIANLTALWAAGELRGVEEVVASAAAHLSVREAAAILGLRYRSAPTDAGGRLRADALGDLSRAALVLTAGTTATGAVDPLDIDPAAAWRHVDAAWAGPLRLSPRHAPLLHGIERADSVAVSAHKWLFQPKECALMLFARPEEAHAALSFGGGYLAVPNVGVLGSLRAWGRRGIAARIERCMDLAADLARLVDAHPDLTLLAPPVTGVVLWRPRGADTRAIRARLRRSVVSLAEVDGQTWFRSVAANPLAEPERVVADVLDALGG
ncbi:MAG: pyridoxal-dependent decarboxylase [Chloroflexota bacterium]|nr:pyridoxal-dependent decarboxylase [Chloroflexota bacterium]